ncbi:MAG: M20/M25/M40 family metallo-hydrolase [Actinomycetota bacterium]|nr:M20/M25/M40 family metallo-hydrolase [Actinomycetota bacterium]
MSDRLLEELFEFLRIPSISTGGGDAQALKEAAEWICARITDAGGTASLRGGGDNPVAAGELASSRNGAPTVLIYGHYDVQGVDPIDEWSSDPFAPELRDGRIYARGASDDKGNFLPLLHVACSLARDGDLPVNVRVVVEGEEEAGGATVAEWFQNDERGADAAIVFDSDMVDQDTPAITISVRGIVSVRLRVRTAHRNLHSGMYGGSVLNAVHALHKMLAGALPHPSGRLPEELRAGAVPPSEEEIASWELLPPGDAVLSEVGGRPLDDRSGAEYYLRNGSDSSLDVNGIYGGDPDNARTIVPATARANLTMRLAPGQDAPEMGARLESLLRSGAPAGAEVEIDMVAAAPALFDPASEPLARGREAIAQATGKPVALVRSGGSIPILALFAQRNIQTIVSGFALSGDQIHAPDESYRVDSLRLGERASRELYAALAKLDPDKYQSARRK